MAELVWTMLRPITALLDPQQVVIAGKIGEVLGEAVGV